ncbi:MAG TPA: peptidoglycan bridge formation protein FemAB, partial [Bacteroidales bacterium]|nr:peptidoglycan bridge formation protein FemAB [Bacteroidales bacterium]
MMLSRETGCDEYDLFGISGNPDPAHPMYGLYRFKTGFGGDIRHQLGCWDYPLTKESYESFRIAETVAVGYHG